MTESRCANCGQPIVAAPRDGQPFWVSPDGENGCDWGETDHPCGGTYRIEDYHQPIVEVELK